MDIKAIIREMLRRGLTPEEIKRNLVELGVRDPERVFIEATEKLKAVKLPGSEEKQAEIKEVSLSQALEEEKPRELFEEAKEGKKLFEEKEEKEVGGEEEIPELKVTKITPEGEEKTLDLAEMMKGIEPSKGVESKNLEKRLKELESSISALKETLKKVLDAQREILLRLKKE